MLKNQLYPYLEKYINEYLWGFSKEQLEVGVMNGTIILEKLNIRADKVNEKLDTKEMPIWFKAGKIGKISISCSLMNFIGEKPLDVNIEDIECVVAPSFKWIIRNLTSFIDENEIQMMDPYDWEDNNSHNIFSRKVNIFNESIFKSKEPIIQLFTDRSKISAIINNLFTKCMKFFYQKTYFINAKINNIHIRFEDDLLINVISNLSMGITISGLEMSLSAEGMMKKNGFKCENLSVYWDPNGGILIPSKSFTDCLDKDNLLDSKYYEILKTLNFRKFGTAPYLKYIVNNFNFMGSFGIQVIDTGNLDFFAQNREKRYKFYLQLASSELNWHMYPDLIALVEHFISFIRSFSIIDPVQEFKPMRKPYNSKSLLVKKFENDPIFSYKRRMLVRDWLFYIVWFKRFKKAVYGKNPNLLHTEFTRFYNIWSLHKEKEATGLNDSIYLKKEKEDGSIIDPGRNAQEVSSDTAPICTENLNPDNIALSVLCEILIKGVNVYLHANTSDKDYLIAKISGCELKAAVGKEKCEVWINMKTLSMNSSMVILGDPGNKHRDLSLLNGNQPCDSKEMEDSFLPPSQPQFFSNKNLPETGALNTMNPKILKRLSILTATLEKISQSKKNNSNIIIQNNLHQDNQTSEINKMQRNLDLLLLELMPDSNLFTLHKSSSISKDIGLSKAINEYNLKKSRSITLPLKYPAQVTIENEKENEKVSLAILEVLNTANHFSVELKYCKINSPENSRDNGADIITLSLGLIRINMLNPYAQDIITLLNSYYFYQQFNKEIKTQKDFKIETFANLKLKKQIYLMKKYMIMKISNGQPVIKSQEEKAFVNFIQSDLECYDEKIASGQFEVNYLYGLLDKKAIEINIKCSDFHVVYYANPDPVASAIGHAKLPKIDFKLVLSLSKLYMKIFGIEVEYSELENCKGLLSNLFAIFEEKLMACSRMYIEPVLSKFQEKEALLPKVNPNPSSTVQKAQLIFPSSTNNITKLNSLYYQNSEKPKSSSGLLREIFPGKGPKSGEVLPKTILNNEDSAIFPRDNSSMNVSAEGKDCDFNGVNFDYKSNAQSKKGSEKSKPSKKK